MPAATRAVAFLRTCSSALRGARQPLLPGLQAPAISTMLHASGRQVQARHQHQPHQPHLQHELLPHRCPSLQARSHVRASGWLPSHALPPCNHHVPAQHPATRPRGCQASLVIVRSMASSREAAAGHEAPRAGSPPAAAAATAPGQVVAVQLPQYCCGCGVKMQQADPEAPGYFIVPAKLLQPPTQDESSSADVPSTAVQEADDYAAAQEDMLAADGGEGSDQQGLPEVLCQRCFSLRHAGRVKVAAAEAQLPEFDLAKKVGRKIALQKDRRAVVLLVVDAADFDGSLPRAALKSLYPPGYDFSAQPTEDTSSNLPAPVRFKLMVALNKVDLLPKDATPARLIQWVKLRMAQAGLPKPDKVFCVSANKGGGVKELVEGVKQGLGFRGDLWVVGAQNAGKSSVIAAMKRVAGTSGRRDPTIAPFAGTTLGLINVPGLPLGPKQRAFDTPGVPHPHQLTSLLTPEEIREVLPGKSLPGRTYRTSRGHTLLVGGLARIDVVDHPGATLYLTLWVSPHINLHLGKTEGAEERVRGQVGRQLTPPDSLERWEALPAATPRTVTVEGAAWDRSSVDVHIAGLGWVAVGVKGRAQLTVWVAPQVQVTTRPALLPDYAREFCRPGYSVALPSSSKHKAGAPAASSKRPQSALKRSTSEDEE